MRKAPQLRFPGFESGWQQYRMGDLTRIFDGTHQTPKYVSSGIPFYSVENVTANNFTDTKYITEEAFTKETKRIERGDILMTRIGDIGTARCIDWDVKASFYVSLALIKSSEGLNSKFLCHYIASDYFQDELWAQTLHVAFPKKINLGDIGSCKISISDIREQQKIADFLTAVGERIELQSNRVEKLQTYKRGLTQKIFTRTLRFKRDDGSDFPEWEASSLGDFLSIPKNARLEKVDRNKIISVKLHLKGVVRNDNIDTIALGADYFIRNSGQFIYGKQNIFNGAIGIVPNELNGYVSSTDIPSLDINTKFVDTGFLSVMIGRKSFYKPLEKLAIGSGSKRIHEKELLKVKVTLPNIEEQQKIATFLSQIDEKITLETKKLKSLKKFKKSLLQKMFI